MKIAFMEATDIADAVALWEAQFDRYCRCDAFPDCSSGMKKTVEEYLSKQIKKENAIVAKQDGMLAGYMAWMCFDFHSERTAFLPTVGNAAVVDNENTVFFELYRTAAEKWVRDNRFNHLWMAYYDDIGLRDMLYDLGFGSYVIDACQNTSSSISATASWRVTKAADADIDIVLELENASEGNLLTAPVFLVRKAWGREDIIGLMNKHEIFLAWDGNRVIGMTSFNINQPYHLERLTSKESAGSLCMYVIPEYRGRGAGKRLLQEAFNFCKHAGKPFLHLSFESANPDAIRFWLKHFKPAIRSVRRTVNKDANSVSRPASCPIPPAMLY